MKEYKNLIVDTNLTEIVKHLNEDEMGLQEEFCYSYCLQNRSCDVVFMGYGIQDGIVEFGGCVGFKLNERHYNLQALNSTHTVPMMDWLNENTGGPPSTSRLIVIGIDLYHYRFIFILLICIFSLR